MPASRRSGPAQPQAAADGPARDGALERREFYERIGKHDLAPLWEVLEALVPEQPAPRCVPALWPYAQARPFLLESGALISAQEATRRVLVLENPALRGQARITPSLYAGLQLLLPGERAPAHRHSQSALRLVLEGEGAHTTVDGAPSPMQRGDLILTPSWRWHEHGSDGAAPTIWLDVLDVPLVELLGTGFREDAPGAERGGAILHGDADADVDEPRGKLAYPYEERRERLERLRRHVALDACHGYRLRYTDPRTGADPAPALASWLHLMPPGFRGAAHRATDAAIWAVVEGRGRTHVGESWLGWAPGDVFVVPSWCACRHETDDTAVLFRCSDRALQEKLGLWREQRADHPGGASD